MCNLITFIFFIASIAHPKWDNYMLLNIHIEIFWVVSSLWQYFILISSPNLERIGNK